MHQRRGVQAEAGAEGQARQRGAAEPRGEGMAERRAAAPTQLSIADGTALHRGRVGSRHFEESPLGLSFFVSTLLYHVATQVCVHRAGEGMPRMALRVSYPTTPQSED